MSEERIPNSSENELSFETYRHLNPTKQVTYIFTNTANINTKTPACLIGHLHQQSQSEVVFKLWSQKAGYATFSLLQSHNIDFGSTAWQSYLFKWNAAMPLGKKFVTAQKSVADFRPIDSLTVKICEFETTLSITRNEETLQLQLEYPNQSYAHQIAKNVTSPEFHEAVTKKKGMGGRPAHIIDKQQPHFPVLLTYTAKQCITLVSCVWSRPSSSEVHISAHFPQFALTPLCPPNIQYSFTKNFQRSHTVRAIQPVTQSIDITLAQQIR